MKVELKNIKMRVPQYEDSIQFHADLFINSKRAGAASNDGNGGSCSYEGYSPEGKKLIQDAEAYFKSLPPINLADPGEDLLLIEQSLEHRISELSYDLYNKKELSRMLLRGFVFGQNGVRQWLEFKKPISHFMKSQGGEDFLKRTLEAEVIPLMKEGDALFNTNLPATVTEKLSHKQLTKNAPPNSQA
ncbi:hypothetical protein [Chitinophaga sp. Ak27]|uniref:hypothetical protein n=1 Tax=Chitinophaga sp. Ak27 TaxID=2726116 RepID=UPI00145E50EE|nr:hypothetical protein [Chitinophaga sp. Ak27]NLU91399.1 hypothetical protein [Chitinophaga sp. Ak27]